MKASKKVAQCISKAIKRAKMALIRTGDRINRNRPYNKGFYFKPLDLTYHPRKSRPKVIIHKYGI